MTETVLPDMKWDDDIYEQLKDYKHFFVDVLAGHLNREKQKN